MIYPIKIVDIELSKPMETISGLDQYMGLQGLVRLHGTPIGYIHVPITGGQAEASTISKKILEEHHITIVHHLLQNGLLANEQPKAFRLEDLFDLKPPEPSGDLPLVTVAVCTRDRTEDLALCLEALCQLNYPHLELMVVDNAPSTTETELLVKNHYPAVRYVQEPRPGLDWARNRAIEEASGAIIAYTDDDVIVDAGWVRALAGVFAENPEAMAVTGLVVPYELETEAQVLFEQYGGFGKGFQRKSFTSEVQGKRSKSTAMLFGCAGQFGTGANMAFRCSVFDNIGYFDPALDVGTVTNGGGDIEMFFRILKEGYTLVYEPGAMVRHRHRRDMEKLDTQITNNGIGLYAFWARSVQAYPEERWAFIRLGLWWLRWWHLRRLLLSYLIPIQFPRYLIIAELKGFFKGVNRYRKACRIAEQMTLSDEKKLFIRHVARKANHELNEKVAIRTIEIKRPLEAINDLKGYKGVELFVHFNDRILGKIHIPNKNNHISRNELAETIISHFRGFILNAGSNIQDTIVWNQTLIALKERYLIKNQPDNSAMGLAAELPVSIVVATYDRPEDLRQCLHSLKAQKTKRPVEIIVVDNHPSSGLTAPVVAEFSNIILIEEQRQGLSYARNAGFTASSGAICVATDDDVTMPSDWLERLLVPFTRPEVMVVTGNVLPMELESPSQRLFESYGGLGRGFENKEVNGKWFEACRHAVPTWQLGATANAAFRSTIFSHPAIGLLEESLGAGMPSGVGEDTYMFYKVLKAGYTICYQADAYVWHKHRNTIDALHKQIYDYSRGGVAYHLTTWLKDKDWRGLRRILFEIPKIFLWRIKVKLRRRSNYPLHLLWLEIKGYLAGPSAYINSNRRVRKLGKSNPYLSPNERSHLLFKNQYRHNQNISKSNIYIAEPLNINPSEQTY